MSKVVEDDTSDSWHYDPEGGLVRIWEDGAAGRDPSFVALVERRYVSLIYAAPEMFEVLLAVERFGLGEATRRDTQEEIDELDRRVEALIARIRGTAS